MNCLLQLLVLILLSALGSSGQTLTYSRLGSAFPQPSPRLDGTITYDPTGRQIFLFGGQDSTPRNDLWIYSLTQRRWTEVQPAGTLPAPRFGHTIVFDAARRRLILFGGQASGFFNDVWALDIATVTWRQLSNGDGGPSRRYGHSAIAETARDRMVISHGFTNAGRFDDTWAFDFASNTWRDISPSGTRPLRRCLHHAAYDAERGQMYLYGGCSSGAGPCPQGDLWSFNLASNRWTELTPRNSPPPREHYGMTFDTARSRLVVFGGNSNGLLNDTWEYDPQRSTWQQASLTGQLPTPRHRQEAAYAGDRGTIFFFGGSTDAGLTNELWMLGLGFVAERPVVYPGGIVNAFSGEAGDVVAPGELVSIFGSGLGPVAGTALQFDPQTGQLPTSGPGVSVLWDGIPSPLLYVQSGQLNVQVPQQLAAGQETRLSVTVNGQASDPITLSVRASRPGLFPQVWNQDGTINSPANPAAPGSVIVLYATGHGSMTSRLRIAGLEVQLLFQGPAPGTVGVLQLNARVPEGLPAGDATVLLFSADGRSSQDGVIAAIR